MIKLLEERADCEIRFPRIVGYRFILPTRKLTARFTAASRLALSSEQVPDRTENAPIVGESAIMTLDDLKSRRTQEVAFLLAKLVLEKYFRQDGEAKPERTERHAFDADVQAWLFPQILQIAKTWLAECVTCKAGTFPQMLLLVEFAHDAADRIYNAIVASAEGEKRLVVIPRRYEPEGSTRFVDFDTTRPVYKTDAGKCHVSHVVADTGSWEQKMAQVLEDMPEVVRYVKNQGLGFAIPYTIGGAERQYLPDFIAQVGDGPRDCLNLLIEVSGEPKKEKAAKVAAARTLWVPGVNNLGQFGRWAFLEITDPWDAENAIRTFLTRHGAGDLEAVEAAQ